MGARARVGLTIALFGLAACEAGNERPSVGTPGLEPPSMRSDAGGPLAQPDPGVPSRGGNATPPLLPGGGGDSSGGGNGGASGHAGASAGAGGAQSTPGLDLDAGVEPGPGDALFTGLWVIDQPSHALYEATLYELGDDGLIGVHDTMLFGAEPWPGYVTGSVENADASLRCVFEGAWRSLEARVVELDARCTDGTTRAVQVELPADQDPATGVSAVVLSVAGDSGWDHRDWPWSWRKCDSRDACVPF